MRQPGGSWLNGLTVIDHPPAVEEEGVQGELWFWTPWLIVLIQAGHSGGNLQVAEAESKGEDVGNSGVHSFIVASVRRDPLLHLHTQHNGEVVPEGDDLQEETSHEERVWEMLHHGEISFWFCSTKNNELT